MSDKQKWLRKEEKEKKPEPLAKMFLVDGRVLSWGTDVDVEKTPDTFVITAQAGNLTHVTVVPIRSLVSLQYFGAAWQG